MLVDNVKKFLILLIYIELFDSIYYNKVYGRRKNMNKSKNIILKLLLINLTAFIVFSSCDKKNSITEPDGKLDKCTLRFSWWGGDDRHEATLSAIKLWSEKHPDIEIKAEYGGWDGWTQKINTQMAGDNEADIMQINYDWLISMSSDGKGFYDLNNLSDYIDFSEYDDEILSFGTRNNHLNAITVSMSGRGFFYNSDLYEELNFTYPTNWDELINLGKAFEKHDVYPIDLDIQSGGTAWYLCVVYVQQKTGKTFIDMNGNLGFDKEDFKTALDFYSELEENKVIRTIKDRIDSDGADALYQSPAFIDGKIGGVLEWGSSVGKYEAVLDENVLEAGEFLSDENGNKAGWMIKPSLMYAISADTKYPDEAAEFLNFLMSDEECAKILGTTRGIPANNKIYSYMEENDMLSGISYISTEKLNEIMPVTVSPYMDLQQIKDYCNTALENVSYGKASTSQAAEQLYTSISEYLEKIK